jgi:hypothetical protein
MSRDSLRRITEGWGQRVEEQQQEAAERASLPAQRGETPQSRRIVEVNPITGQANVSTDGGMMLIREEGWKEVELVTFSEVEIKPAAERPAKENGASRRAEDPFVQLKEHSYQAGLWDADTIWTLAIFEGGIG